MNVIDELKDKTVEEIREYCERNSVGAAVAMFNVGYDYNIAQLIRSANFFGFREVFHIQKEGRRIDKRGTVGTHNYTPLIHFYTPEEFFKYIKDKYIPVAIENNVPGCKSLYAAPVTLRPSPCYMFGSENAGLPQIALDKAESKIFIPGRGSVRSLNVGTTAGIVMYNHLLNLQDVQACEQRLDNPC